MDALKVFEIIALICASFAALAAGVWFCLLMFAAVKIAKMLERTNRKITSAYLSFWEVISLLFGRKGRRNY